VKINPVEHGIIWLKESQKKLMRAKYTGLSAGMPSGLNQGFKPSCISQDIPYFGVYPASQLGPSWDARCPIV